MITVLHIIDSLGIGGTQPMLVGLCNHELNPKNGVNHRVLSLHGVGKENFYKKLTESNIEVTNLSRNKYNIFLILLRLIFFLNNKKSYDIIHTHLRISTLFAVFIKRIMLIDKPLVTGVYEQKNQLPKSYSFFSKYKSTIDFYIAMSLSDSDDLKSTGIPSNKIIDILPLVDIEGGNDDHSKSKQLLAQMYNIPPDHLILMSLSRINKDRQIHKIVEILPEISNKEIKATLIIVGDGPEKKNLIDYANKNGISNNIVWAGIRYDIWDILPGCDLYLSASADCLVSLAAIEAMACSRPVITYNINTMNEPEIICDSRGYFITTRDKEAFTNAVCRFLKNEELRLEFGKKAKENIFKDISIKKDTSVQKYIELYKKLLNK